VAEPMTEASARTRLPLAFKGSRDYLQGGDIFNALADLTGAREGISLQMKKVMRHPLDSVSVPAGRPGGGFSAWFEYGGAGNRHCIGLLEDASSEVPGRMPYDEDAVIAGAHLSEARIESPGPGVATFIERVIALNKVLLNARFAPQKLKWWFTRLELEMLPAAPRSIALTLAASVGARLTKSIIEVDGVPCGHIYFSRDRK
jgi:hypothetical protein